MHKYLKHILSILLILILQLSFTKSFASGFSNEGLCVGIIEFSETGKPNSDFSKSCFRENNIFETSFLEVVPCRSVSFCGVYAELVESWKSVLNARGANSVWKTDIDLLEKLADLKANSIFMTHVGGEDGLEAILKANVRAGCKSCGNAGQSFLKNIDEYLGTVK